MKSLHIKTMQRICIAFVAATATLSSVAITAPLSAQNTVLTVGIVDFKQCVEESLLGKKERETFDEMRRQMESTLEEKEGTLQDMARKFQDPDYVDGLSPEAEAKAKDDYRQITQEIGQLQQQYYQMLNQANFKVIQNLAEHVAEAAKQIANKKGLSLVLNEESSFYYADSLNITNEVIKALNAEFEKGNSTSSEGNEKNKS